MTQVDCVTAAASGGAAERKPYVDQRDKCDQVRPNPNFGSLYESKRNDACGPTGFASEVRLHSDSSDRPSLPEAARARSVSASRVVSC